MTAVICLTYVNPWSYILQLILHNVIQIRHTQCDNQLFVIITNQTSNHSAASDIIDMWSLLRPTSPQTRVQDVEIEKRDVIHTCTTWQVIAACAILKLPITAKLLNATNAGSKSTVNSSQRYQTRRSTRHTILRCDKLTVWRVDWTTVNRNQERVCTSFYTNYSWETSVDYWPVTAK